jgi:GNAT superfamily N-acetyltransferase
MTSGGSEPSIAPSVRSAGHADAAELAELINQAYEIEQFFVDGKRTTADEVARLAETGWFLVLDRPGQGLAAAVYVRADRGHGWLGMLSVSPDLQGLGLGRRLVGVAEALCSALGCTEMALQVVNLRAELEAWYRSLGYREVGTSPYQHRRAKQPCHFVKMQKPLAA